MTDLICFSRLGYKLVLFQELGLLTKFLHDIPVEAITSEQDTNRLRKAV